MSLAAADEHVRVMLVDDTEALRFALGRVLRLYGFDVCEASDGRDALDHVAGFQPQVVLTDLMMPVMDGVELIRHLHAAPETSAIPVVVLTANVTPEADESARDAGACAVMAKPIDLPQLVETLRDVHVHGVNEHDPRAAAGGALDHAPVRARLNGLGCCTHTPRV